MQPRGISHADWSIHSIQSRPRNVPVEDYHGYDAGPFVWSFTPTHDANMRPLDKPYTHCTVLVLESREDVQWLFKLLDRNSARWSATKSELILRNETEARCLVHAS